METKTQLIFEGGYANLRVGDVVEVAGNPGQWQVVDIVESQTVIVLTKLPRVRMRKDVYGIVGFILVLLAIGLFVGIMFFKATGVL